MASAFAAAAAVEVEIDIGNFNFKSNTYYVGSVVPVCVVFVSVCVATDHNDLSQ